MRLTDHSRGDDHATPERPTSVRRCEHVFSLREAAWCDDHYDHLFANDADRTYATLELLERALIDRDIRAADWACPTPPHTDTDTVTGVGDIELRIDFEADPYDPPVRFSHTVPESHDRTPGTDCLDLTPLCCLVDADDRLAAIDAAVMLDDAAGEP